MELTENEKQIMKNSWITRQKSKHRHNSDLRRDALQYAYSISSLLREKYNIKEVYLFGSLAKNDKFDTLSDIDIFIKGTFNDRNYWKMLSEAQNIAGRFSVSILTEKDALPQLIETIFKEGRLLY